MIIGIDLSLNSSGFCLFDEVKKEYRFLANINLCKFSTMKQTPTLQEFLNPPPIQYTAATLKKHKLKPPPEKDNWMKKLSELADVKLLAHERPIGQGKGHVEIGHLRLQNVDKLSRIYIDTIFSSEFFEEHRENITAIGIEDFSLAKVTEAIVITIETCAYFKQAYLLPLVPSYERIYTIPGPKAKMLAGNGNANKLQMFMAFIDLDDELLKATPFHKFCRQHIHSIVHRADVLSPVNDMIDAFWMVKYTQDVILGGYEIPKKKKTKKK